MNMLFLTLYKGIVNMIAYILLNIYIDILLILCISLLVFNWGPTSKTCTAREPLIS